jgi:trimeric autotransporter adhesin
MTINGTAGNDNLTGTSGADTFNLYQGGNDTAQGLGGNDIFSFGAAFTAADSIDGGTGSDTLRLNGDYSAGVTFAAATMVNVEQIQLSAGHDYALTTNDANIAAGQSLTINAAALGAGDTLNLDGLAETDGTFRVEGGAGDDIVSLGAAFVTGDRLDGGAGNDSLFLDGDYDFSLGSTTIRNIEQIDLEAGHNYTLITSDANIAAGATMTVDAHNVAAGNTVDFSGLHELDGSLDFDGGSGLMKLTGGAQSDTFFMGAHLVATDHLNGGGGSDTLFIGGADYNENFTKTTIQSIENLKLGSGFDYHLTLGGAIATDATMVMDATALTASDTLFFDAHKETLGSVVVDGGAAPATIIGTQQGDAFDFNVAGQGGLTATDSIDGQAGYDRLYLDGDYTGSHALALTNTTVTNVEEFDLGAGFSYSLTLAADTIASGTSLKIDASALGAANTLTFDGSAATSTATLDIIAGAGNDTLTGGAGGDTFDLRQGGDDTVTGGSGDNTFIFGAALTADDTIDGGDGGNNTITLNGNYDLTFTASTFTNIQTLTLGGGHNYSLTTAAENDPYGTILTVDAGALGAGNTLTFDASAQDAQDDDSGQLNVIGGAGNDTVKTGDLGGTFDLSEGGEDTVTGGDFGGSTFNMGAALDSGDRLDGGGAGGLIILDGDHSGTHAITLDNTILQNIARLIVDAGHNYHITYTGTLPTPADDHVGFRLEAGALGASDTLNADFSASEGLLTIIGGAGNDAILGTAEDTIDLSKGGNDTANVAGGTAIMGAALNSGDKLTNVGTLSLNGDYDAADGTALNLTTANVSGGAAATLGFGHTYDITVSSASVISSLSDNPPESGLFATVTFNGAAEASHGFSIDLFGNDGSGGQPTNTITTGGGNDTVSAFNGQTLIFHGNGGNDTVTLDSIFGSSQIDGGAGNDTLNFGMSEDTTFTDSSITNIETLVLSGGSGLTLTMADGNVAAGQTLIVQGADKFNGSAETDGHYNILASAFGNVIGGALSDTITLAGGSGSGGNVTGGGGGDTIDLGSTSNFETLHYGAVSDSTSVNYDTIKHVNFANDTFDLSTGDPTAIDARVATGALSTASFDSDLAAAVGAAQLAAHHALLFTPNSGTLSGHKFLIVDANGVAGYQAGADLVIDVSGATGTPTTGDFG